jgi:hypothetical protein
VQLVSVITILLCERILINLRIEILPLYCWDSKGEPMATKSKKQSVRNETITTETITITAPPKFIESLKASIRLFEKKQAAKALAAR